jgi:predicted RNA-binding Zn ribbon-like protein
MSKHQEAPGDLERVREFVNTWDIEAGTDELASAAALGRWLSEHGLAPEGVRASRKDLDEAIALREALRAVLLSHNDSSPVPQSAYETLDDAVCRATVRLRFDQHGSAALEAKTPGVAGALGRLLAVVQASIAQGTWARLKACRDHTCEWAFYDHTKNRSGAWCTMEVCGNRAKARAYRERQVGAAQAG